MHTQEITQNCDSGWDWILLANDLATDITHIKPTLNSGKCTPCLKMADKNMPTEGSRSQHHGYLSTFLCSCFV